MTLGCYPNWLHFKIKTLGCHPNWPQGAPVAAPLENPGLFNCALPLAGYVSATLAIAANAAATRYFRFGFEPARKQTLAVSHHSLNIVLKAARGYVIRKIDAGWFDLLLHLSRGEGRDGVLVLAAQWSAKPPPGLPIRSGRSKATARKRLHI
ncbi:hypothetical protein BV494_01205 [Rahnella sikkimica]|uniref:Uncharacterized protein n=1 Tax=Rahnella sikkimica TaxID=1805933 RepID=A0A2L1UL24_9GAMM|nr:hypothetical protein BV494_01205 [Rahnella sikkimica]